MMGLLPPSPPFLSGFSAEIDMDYIHSNMWHKVTNLKKILYRFRDGLHTQRNVRGVCAPA